MTASVVTGTGTAPSVRGRSSCTVVGSVLYMYAFLTICLNCPDFGVDLVAPIMLELVVQKSSTICILLTLVRLIDVCSEHSFDSFLQKSTRGSLLSLPPSADQHQGLTMLVSPTTTNSIYLAELTRIKFS